MSARVGGRRGPSAWVFFSPSLGQTLVSRIDCTIYVLPSSCLGVPRSQGKDVTEDGGGLINLSYRRR